VVALFAQLPTNAHANASAHGSERNSVRRINGLVRLTLAVSSHNRQVGADHCVGSYRVPTRVSALARYWILPKENVKEPLSPGGSATDTTFVRSRTDETSVCPRALPADRKNPICSPTCG
jgi:hypothetical protein